MTAIAPHTIKLTELPSMPLEWYKALPKCAAVYLVLSSDNEVLYIGQSVNIQNRWRSHHIKRHLKKLYGVRIAWLQVSDSSLLETVELALIEFLKPKLNRPPTLNKKPRTPNVGLIALRKRINLTQRQLAKAVGVTEQTISNWETGLSEPLLTIPQTLALCKALRCSLDKLIDACEITKTENNP